MLVIVDFRYNIDPRRQAGFATNVAGAAFQRLGTSGSSMVNR